MAKGDHSLIATERLLEMTMSRLTKPALVLAGLTALAISLAILFAPTAFYGSYGIALGPDPSLLNELSAPALMLLLLLSGGVMLAGVFREALSRPALILAVGLYGAYALSRGMNMALHGLPDSGLVMAALIELLIGGLAALALKRSVHDPLRD